MHPVAGFPSSDAPISATVLAAFMLGVLALVYLALARRDHEPGMGWLGVSFTLAALWFGLAGGRPPTSPLLITPEDRFWGGALLFATLMLAVGIMIYLRAGWARCGAWRLMLVPGLLVIAALVLALDVPRLVVNLGATVCYVGLAALAFRCARAEPGHGHRVVGAALLTVPLTFVVLVAAHVAPGNFRVLGVMPSLFLGLVLLTVSLLRRRRALEAEILRRAAAEDALQQANQGLEAVVLERTAALRELVSSLEGFNRTVSHDLRGPLGGIASLSRMAEEALAGGDVAMVRRSLSAISLQADSSAKMVTALLQLAHVGDARLARRSVALRSLVDEVITQLKHAPATAAAADTAHWEVGALPDVQADADLLRPVLVNLFGNALKFSDAARPPAVRIDATVGSAEVTVHVRDNGVGFDAAAAGRLFQPFMRLHGQRFEGHGIGLSIVRRAVERHGGRVWAEAEPDRGAAFHFTLPGAA